MSRREGLVVKVFALAYAVCVIAALSLSFWPGAESGGGLVAVVLALPWGIGIVLLLNTIDPPLVYSLGPPLVALGGLLNVYLFYNALKRKD